MTRSFSRHARDYSSPRNLYYAWLFADPLAARCAMGASAGDIGRSAFILDDPSRVAHFEDATESTKELFK